MTEIQLNKGNELTQELMNIKRSLSSLRKVLKEIELSGERNFGKTVIEIRLDRTDCVVDCERMSEFLWKEVKVLESEIKEKESEFENI